ncbi:arylsulfatase [Plebeiibacterium marinum]|uniref:Arylsulfatase n=1 Tax=Plebeiibacterium marinum TaxID=2992111 RepID=A0AAE3MEM8_9BACT|nr:arylsulfatase [Plebeiobacterium marinum]MCW3806538.1 arylsulfatase [Plebeiobacterium marinum]
MIKPIVKLLLGAILFTGCITSKKKETKPPRPNILLIMLDDMGYSDLGSYGGEVNTPNIDRLATDGIRFTQMNNCARCCPTRASLLTGQYPHIAGINGMGVNLSMNTATIAEVLKENGYSTGMTGKWHLSQTKALNNHNEQLRWLANQTDHGPFSPLENYPCNRGFQEHWGNIWGVVNFFDPFSLVHNEEPIKEVPDDFYMTDFITDKSLDLLDQYSKDDKPFFLYVAHTAPHWPLHALPEDIEKYKDTYKCGWDEIRKNRYQRMVEMGLVDQETYPLPENSSGKKWDDCDNKEYEAACMSVHAAMIDHVDQGVGKLIQKLKETNQYENTLIMVLSDNGASYERGYPPGFDRPGFTRDSVMIEYNASNPGSKTTWNYIGNAWASASNTPFRYWKKESYQGGTATPFIVHWPKELSSQANTLNRSVAHVIDVMPTCLEAAGANYPDSINGQKALKPVGKSMMPLFTGKLSTVHDTLYWEHEGGKAIRTGNWRMAALPGQNWELFNLTKDHTETKNLAEAMPEKVAELSKVWESWAIDNGIIAKN